MQSLPVIDTHSDLVLSYQKLNRGFSRATSNTQTSLSLLKKANVKILFGGFSYDDLLEDSQDQFEKYHEMLNRFGSEFELILDFSLMQKVLNSKKIGLVIHLEGAKILNGKIQNLEKFYERGLRSLGIVHNTKNGLGTGAVVDDGTGLTKFGKEVVKKCNELNIVLDVSHLNEKGFWDVFNLSKKPVIVSHGNAYSITSHPRNFKDDQLKEVARAKTFVGIFFSGKFLNPDIDGSKATISDAIKHLEHMVEIMGVDHVAIGSDFGGITTGLPRGLENHSKLDDFFGLLKKRGFKKNDLEKIAYKNALRVLGAY